MIDKRQKRILILALFAGELMMRSGAEIYRVEDTVTRICRACKINYVECFAINTGIIVSLDSGDEESDVFTFIKRTRNSQIDLERVSLINDFSRVFTTTSLSVEAGFQRLREIAATPGYSMLWRVIGAILIGAFFCPLYKGSFSDMFIAGAISGVTWLVSYAISLLRFADFIRILVSCMAAAGLVLFAAALGAGDSISPVVVAATTIFLPGVAITNCARDFLSGDMLAGGTRLAETAMAAVAIAAGVGIGIRIWIMLGGELGGDRAVEFTPPWFLLFGFFSTAGFCLLFNCPKRLIAPVSTIGAIGMFLLQFLTPTSGMISACFFGTCAIAILAEFAARIFKDATTIFIIPGIIPFVPGVPLYQTMSNMLVGNYSESASIGVEALIIAGSIAIAIVLVATFSRLTFAVGRRIRRHGQTPPC